MTKVSVFGQETEKKKRRIKFVKYLDDYGNVSDCNISPSDCENVQLFLRASHSDALNVYDIILIWGDSNPERNTVILGHWNDGVV